MFLKYKKNNLGRETEQVNAAAMQDVLRAGFQDDYLSLLFFWIFSMILAAERRLVGVVSLFELDNYFVVV